MIEIWGDESKHEYIKEQIIEKFKKLICILNLRVDKVLFKTANKIQLILNIKNFFFVIYIMNYKINI